MDIGMIVIHLAGGVATVSRCEDAPSGVRLVAALNAPALADQAAQVLLDQKVGLSEDGVYLCTDELQAAADFPPLVLPADAITFGEARKILYPEVSPNTAWQRVHRDMKARRFRVYRVGIGQGIRTYVSRSEIEALAEARAAEGVTAG